MLSIAYTVGCKNNRSYPVLRWSDMYVNLVHTQAAQHPFTFWAFNVQHANTAAY